MKQGSQSNDKAHNIKIKPYFNFNILFPSYERTYSINRYDYELLQELNYINNPFQNKHPNSESNRKYNKKADSGETDRVMDKEEKHYPNYHIKYPCYDDSNNLRSKDLYKIPNNKSKLRKDRDFMYNIFQLEGEKYNKPLSSVPNKVKDANSKGLSLDLKRNIYNALNKYERPLNLELFNKNFADAVGDKSPDQNKKNQSIFFDQNLKNSFENIEDSYFQERVYTEEMTMFQKITNKIKEQIKKPSSSLGPDVKKKKNKSLYPELSSSKVKNMLKKNINDTNESDVREDGIQLLGENNHEVLEKNPIAMNDKDEFENFIQRLSSKQKSRPKKNSIRENNQYNINYQISPNTNIHAEAR